MSMYQANDTNGANSSAIINESLAKALGGTVDSNYFQNLLAEKDKEI